MRGERWLPAAELARRAGLDARTVRRWCAAGLVRARRRGPKLWSVDVGALKIGADWERELYKKLIGVSDPSFSHEETAAEGD